jgi:hypothetical protein
MEKEYSSSREAVRENLLTCITVNNSLANQDGTAKVDIYKFNKFCVAKDGKPFWDQDEYSKLTNYQLRNKRRSLLRRQLGTGK